MAFIKCPRNVSIDGSAESYDYVRLDSIDVIGEPRYSRDGGSWTVAISVSGQTITPMFGDRGACEEFYTQLKNGLGISD